MLQTERTSGGDTIAECVRCGCFFAYHRKVKLDANGNPITLPADHIERGSIVACPACGYFSKALLAKGKTATFFTLLFLAVFPALMLMFAGPLASQAHLISDDTADLLFNLCVYATIGIAALAVVAGLLYHPSRAPFKKWETQGRVLKEGRAREAWSNPEEMKQAAAQQGMPVAVVAAKVEESVEDIAPPADFVPPKSRGDDDDDEEEEEESAAAATPGGLPRPMPRPHVATPAPPPAAEKSDTIVLQCPQCQKKFRAPRAVLAQAPKCKACHVPLNDVTGQHGV